MCDLVIYTNLGDRSDQTTKTIRGEIDGVKRRHESTNTAACPLATHNQTALTTLYVYAVNAAAQLHDKTIKVK